MERGDTSGKAVCIGLRLSWRGATPQIRHVYRAVVAMERGNTSGKAMSMYREYAKPDCLMLRIY